MSNEIDDIRRLAGITENEDESWITRKHDLSHDIWKRFGDILNDIEEMKKATGDDTYLRILNVMAKEISKRSNI